ncbi:MULTISPECIES: Gfo/Idh/MocA family protein [Pacificibacter]|uniref:Gfo/Idh/MocA family protein n=1 Tax=Pacificibacter TaxID=1042323 RepID=UPI001C08BBB9|nr:MULTISPECIES: Gfo/Idh/MocA family oxidoreductase [Pacificibacter]MBU2936432.1 Gfo/Idh/MocA family oxidoreductase [Pacificibacter marinus]MDO6616527.1 Gfo/Idh/MocA family oxidoreductase [Pacificibacter sp. 1_MG-2023]
MTTTHYGIIGCGMMGQEHLRNIALLPDTKVTAIYEPDPNMAEIAASFAPDAQFCDSIDALLAIEALDCLVIVSPNFCHMDQLEKIAATRPLPVLVEKPLFTDPADVTRLKAFQDNYPAPVWVAMEYRYMPPVAALRSAVDDATGGIKMLTIREHRFPFLPKVGDWNRFNEKSGGTFVEKCCHFFDLMRLLTKSEPLRIMASAGQNVNHLDEVYEGKPSDILDNGYVIVDFANGMRAMLELCMFAEGARYQEEISAVGPKGKIEALVPGPGRFWPAHLGDAPIPQLIVSPRDPKGPEVRDIPVDPTLLEAGDHNGSTFYQHEGFLALVRGERALPDVSLNDGWKAVAMGMAAQKSALTGQVVTLDEFAAP